MATSALNICSLRAGSMGSMRAWLPSRRSTEHQIGAFQISRLGHSRSARRVGRGRKGTYFSTGIFLGLAGTGGILESFCVSIGLGCVLRGKQKPPAQWQEVAGEHPNGARLR